MKATTIKILKKAWAFFFIISVGYAFSANKNSEGMNKGQNAFEQGTYGYDVAFLKEHGVEVFELKDNTSQACILLAPGYQGRVMTSSAKGEQGQSFGWINYKLIESGKVSTQFNPVGGEERFWLGPEGGPFSIYFEPGAEQVFENWKVPDVLDTERFNVKEQTPERVTFEKETKLKNASETEFNLVIERTVRLLKDEDLELFFNTSFAGSSFDIVAYRSENTITNGDTRAWTKESGLLSIWMLCMFSPSPTTTVFIPCREEGTGPVVNDDYFGKVPSDRLIIDEGVVYFKIDGSLRSKIGIPPERAEELCGSYDSVSKTLTLVWGSLPSELKSYVSSRWGNQDDPYDGDAINAYNDGPVDDGTIMGPFYEIETSSPAADLQPGESLTHVQLVVHVQGEERELARLVDELFGLNLDEIASRFK